MDSHLSGAGVFVNSARSAEKRGAGTASYLLTTRHLRREGFNKAPRDIRMWHKVIWVPPNMPCAGDLMSCAD